MEVLSVVGGEDSSAYEKTVVMLHGGGSNSEEWLGPYKDGWFGNMTGIKYVWPTSPLGYHSFTYTLTHSLAHPLPPSLRIRGSCVVR